jgi:hypothetical protein
MAEVGEGSRWGGEEGGGFALYHREWNNLGRRPLPPSLSCAI